MNIKSILLALMAAIMVVAPPAYDTYRTHTEKQAVINEIYADFGAPPPSDLDPVIKLEIFLLVFIFVIILTNNLWINWYTNRKQMSARTIKFTKLTIFLSIPIWQFFIVRYTDVYKSLGYKTGSEPVWPYAVGLLLFFTLLGLSFVISDKLQTKKINF